MLLESVVVQLLSCGFCIHKGWSYILHLVINLLMSLGLRWTVRNRKWTDVATAWPQLKAGVGSEVRLYMKTPIIL